MKTQRIAEILKSGAVDTDVVVKGWVRTKRGNTKKSVSECSADELQCVAFVISHTMEKGHKPQAKDMISVEALERLTGFTYFPNVPNAPKKTFTPSDWL